MPLPLASLAVTAGQTYTVSVGTRGTVGAVVIANESPYSLQVSTGSGGLWIVAQTADLVPCDSTAFNGNLTITADNYLSNASNAPSFLVYMTAYAPGEAVRGTYPAALVRLANGGAAVTVASSVVNDNSALGTNIIESTPTGQLTSWILMRNDGTVQLQSTSNNAATPTLQITPGGVATRATVALDNGAIATNGAGALTVAQLNGAKNAGGPAQLVLLATGQNVQYEAQNTTNALDTFQLFQVFNGTALVTALAIGGHGGTFGPGNAALDSAGVLRVPSPPILLSGNQEIGACGLSFVATGAGNGMGYLVNFKTHLTNVPSSITLTVVGGQGNNSAPTATNITQDGFLFFLSATAAGTCHWQGEYTTVGN